MFSRPVKEVSGTQIYGRVLPDGRQALAYSMKVGLLEPTAMVLPLPVPPSPGEDALEFVDLQRYRNFFDYLDATLPLRKGMRFARAESRTRRLKVQRVGDFDASFVPTLSDFERLDPRFRISDDVWSKLPLYADWGFAVFKLREKRTLFWRRLTSQKVQPMAFLFPSREPGAVFFPTMHVHDGRLPEKAKYDHALYAQVDELTMRAAEWEFAAKLRRIVPDDLGDFVDLDAPMMRQSLDGVFVNEDTWLRPLSVEDPALLDQRGPLHRVFLGLQYLTRKGRDTKTERWAKQAPSYAQTLPAALHAELGLFLATKQTEWGLKPLDEVKDKGQVVSGSVVHMVASTPTGPRPVRLEGPLRLEFRVSTDSVEPQTITLAFESPPSDEAYAEIGRGLRAFLDQLTAA